MRIADGGWRMADGFALRLSPKGGAVGDRPQRRMERWSDGDSFEWLVG
jgi:hypothetical protein